MAFALLAIYAEVQVEADTILPATETAVETEPTRTRVQELEGLRETNAEIYLMSDGTYECVVYAEDKYYCDDGGDLLAIDNSVVPLSATKIGTPYKNAGNAFDVYFSSAGTPTVSINYRDFGVAFSPTTNAQNNVISAGKQQLMSVGAVNDCSTLAGLTATGNNTVRSADAFGSADLVYVLTNSMLKEYIILENSNAPLSYCFAVALDGLSAHQTDGVILLKDKQGNIVFTLGNLFAVDATGAMTEALTYAIATDGSSDEFFLTVTLDSGYLKDSERVFPVVIDPSIMISSAQTADAYVSSANPNSNYYMDGYLRTGRDYPYGVRRSYIKFDIPEGIPHTAVTSAYLDVVMVSGVAPTVRAYKCSGDWKSNTITWNNQPGYRAESGTAYAVPRSSGSTWYRLVSNECDGYY